MKKNYHHTAAWFRTAALVLAVTAAATAGADEKPATPVNLRAEGNYSHVTLTWQRSATAADTLLKEGFEGDQFPPEGWQLQTTNTNDPSFTWFKFPTEEIAGIIEDYTSYIHSGESSAFVNFDMNAPYDDGTPGTQDEWLITPEVQKAAYLDFWCKIPSQVKEWGATGEFPNHYYVKVSHDGGKTWKVLWDGPYDSNGSDDWQAVSLYLGDPSQGAPMVAFQATDGSDNPDMSLFATWAIDDVCFTTGEASDKAMESFNVYYDDEEIATDVKALSFVDGTDKEPGNHKYTVRSYNSATDALSDPAEVNVAIKEATVNAPQHVKVTSTYDDKTGKYNVQMTWEAPAGERVPDHYTVYCNNAMFGDYLEDTSVEQTGLAKGVYDYSVTAVYTYPDGESEAVGDQVALGTRFPARNLEVGRNGEGKLTLAWEAPKTSDHAVKDYKIYRGNTLLAEQPELAYTDSESPQGNYDYNVKAVYDDGYEAMPASKAVTNGTAPVYSLPFSEDFTGGLKPANWTVTKNRSGLKDNYLWRFDNWYELPVSGGGFDADFASAMSSSAGYTTVNTSIYTPQLSRASLPDGEKTWLEFDMDYEMGGSSFAYLAYSVDNGKNWNDLIAELQGYTADQLAEGETCRPQHMQVDVTDLFAGNAKVQFAWTYNGKNAQHMAIDNVRVFNADPTGITAATRAAGSLRISGRNVSVNGDGPCLLQLYSLDGRLVRTAQADSQVSVAAPGAGTWLVKIQHQGKTTTAKVVLK